MITFAQADEFHFRAFGVPFTVRSNVPGFREEILPTGLPPNCREVSGHSRASHRISVMLIQRRTGELGYQLVDSKGRGYALDDNSLASRALSHLIEECLASRSPDRIFVHSGAVGWKGRAILLPGASFAGKSTLVSAMIGAGATYLSDEFAVLTQAGQVEPYPRLLSLRTEDGQMGQQYDPHDLGCTVESGQLPIALIAFLQFKRGSSWSVREISTSNASLELLSHAYRSPRKADLSLESIAHAVAGPRLIQGTRGDANEAVDEIFAILDSID